VILSAVLCWPAFASSQLVHHLCLLCPHRQRCESRTFAPPRDLDSVFTFSDDDGDNDGAPRGGLLDAIRKGKKLKKAQTKESVNEFAGTPDVCSRNLCRAANISVPLHLQAASLVRPSQPLLPRRRNVMPLVQECALVLP
jgi:hypothetical protein